MRDKPRQYTPEEVRAMSDEEFVEALREAQKHGTYGPDPHSDIVPLDPQSAVVWLNPPPTESDGRDPTD